MLLQKVLPLRELKLSTTKEEWEELIRESISQVTEVTSFNMLNVWTAHDGRCVHWCGGLVDLECEAVLPLTHLCGVVPAHTRAESCPLG